MSLRPPLALFVLLAPLAASATGSPTRPAALVRQDPADEQYRYLAGLADKGMNELAEKEARAFLRDHPRHAKADLARYRLAGALWELDQHAEATREYERLARVEGFEYRAECLYRLGQGAAESGDEARARAAFQGVLAAGQDYLLGPARFALGELDFRAGRFDQAEGAYAELLRRTPECAEAPLARRALVWCAWQRGDAPETVRRARAFLEEERDPARREELSLLLGEALLGSDPKAALSVFRTLRSPEQADARARGEGFALAALGDHAGAARAFEGLLERDPPSPFAAEAALQAGIELLRAGDARGAIRRLESAAKDGSPETLYWLAQADKQAERLEAALAAVELALRAKPAEELRGRLQILRGDCLVASGHEGEALAAYEASGSSAALHAAAVAALNLGDGPGARRLAERGLRLADSEEQAQGLRVVLAEATFTSQRYPEAEEALARARQGARDPAERARLDSRLAWCRYLQGDLAAAKERFSALLDAAPASPEGEEAQAMLARLAGELGDGAAARAQAARYLERYPDGRFADQALLTLARNESGPEARRRYASWLERFGSGPLAPGVRLELADLESAAGAHADAARHYGEVRAAAPDSAEGARAAYGLAWCAWEQHDFDACQRALAPLLAKNSPEPGLRPAALELALWAQVEEGQLEDALATWRALAATKGDEAKRLAGARRILAALRTAKRTDEAKALLDECRRSLGTSALVAEVELEGAYLALEREAPTEAEAALARARKAGASEAGLAEASYHVGEARLAAGDVPRALALFERAAESSAGGANPRAADALYKLGFVHLERGEPEAAAQALGNLLERAPTGELAEEARFLLGECAWRQGKFEETARRMAEARETARGELRAKVLFRGGLALGELARWGECEAWLSELARAFPEFPNLAESELWRGRALLAQRKARAARGAFERTLALDQGELAAGARLGLGQVAEAEGRLEDALSEYLKVALLFAHEASVSEALLSAGRVLEAQGARDQAIARYEELCREHPDSPLVPRARARLEALGATARGERAR